MAIDSTNPATEEIVATIDEFTTDEVDAILDDADAAFRGWSRTGLVRREAVLRRSAELLRARKEAYARLITLEMGKPITAAEAEIEKCAWNCDYYADNAELFLETLRVDIGVDENYVQFMPLGVVLAVMPWNFPFWQVFRFAAPALVAGNAAVLKHASNVSLCAQAIEEVIRDAGAPGGLFRTLLIPSSAVEAVIRDHRVSAVTLTGSDLTGEKVAAVAGSALKKMVLELGGSDPFVVLADADVEDAATTGVAARFQNAGQSCIAAKRFIVEASVADEFEQRFVEKASRLTVGDPFDRATDIGPLARPDLLDTLDRQVRASVARGAHVKIGGAPLERTGYFYPATVLTNVTATMPVAREETFGPVAPLLRVPDADAAIALANASDFGLGASVWTRDLDHAREIARGLECGSVFLNGMVASDPRLPFGGVKRSGYGRELSAFGIREFVNIQAVSVRAVSRSGSGDPVPARASVE